MKPTRSFAALLVASSLIATASDAQTVLVRVMDEETSLPKVGALAYLVDEAGATVRNALTDERGRALFVEIADGSFDPYSVPLALCYGMALAQWRGDVGATRERATREAPLARWGTPEDVAAVARFLVSPAAEFLTGQVVRVNGGAVR